MGVFTYYGRVINKDTVNDLENGITALMLSINDMNTKKFKQILELNPDLSVRDSDGFTALQVAERDPYGQKRRMAKLIKRKIAEQKELKKINKKGLDALKQIMDRDSAKITFNMASGVEVYYVEEGDDIDSDKPRFAYFTDLKKAVKKATSLNSKYNHSKITSMYSLEGYQNQKPIWKGCKFLKVSYRKKLENKPKVPKKSKVPKKVAKKTKKTKKALSKDLCKEFIANKSVNPLTGRKIKKDGPMYKKLIKDCQKLAGGKKRK